jgi:pyruvate,water dikinase
MNAAEENRRDKNNHWQWRLKMAERIAAELDPVRFGVKALYVMGSTKNANAGPASDIDLLIHFDGTSLQQSELLLWLEGWSLALDEINFQRTRFRNRDFLDIHIVTDEDIEAKSSYAVKIGAISDAARRLPLKNEIEATKEEASEPHPDSQD